ncbi:hypothetical protein OTU49_011661 [Cherax quadricarinatus]|uniref:Sodium/potassium-transporting ATPase subunit beta-2 n=1 Tax=Cherax quadricarinatus TaxID=27406 RepID=A0AAW0W230_CHEQU
MEDINDLYKRIAERDRGFKTFVWNPKKKAFFGRTGASWFKILLFYVIFYLCLTAFFALNFSAFYQTLDIHHLPRYTPGDGGSILQKVAYEGKAKATSGQHITDCSDDHNPKEGEVCSFKDTWLTGNCQKAEKWGFNRQSPCILLKLNRMIRWEPEVYETLEELPEKMPQSLKDHIKKSMKENEGKIPRMIWVSCEGEEPADQEYIGPLRYSPWQGFPAYYFPYMNTPGYLPPVVAVQFLSPASHVLISIKCRAWAKNIEHDDMERLGLIHFEMLKD